MDFNLYATLGQVPSEDAGQIFRDHLRGCVREPIAVHTVPIIRGRFRYQMGIEFFIDPSANRFR